MSLLFAINTEVDLKGRPVKKIMSDDSIVYYIYDDSRAVIIELTVKNEGTTVKTKSYLKNDKVEKPDILSCNNCDNKNICKYSNIFINPNPDLLEIKCKKKIIKSNSNYKFD